MAKKKIQVTLEIEPPYTSIGIFTLLGGSENGCAVASKALKLFNNMKITVGENGGIETETIKRRKSKDE